MDIVQALLKQQETFKELANDLGRLQKVQLEGIDMMQSILMEYARESGHDFDDKYDVQKD